jgi:hypothetical protein
MKEISTYYLGFLLLIMITVVEFRAKQATGSKYMPTDKLYDDFENQTFATFQVRQSIQINSDEKIIGI